VTTPVVLIHGGGFAASCWDLVVERLDGPALAVDLPGRGAHPEPLESVTLASAASSVVADVDAAGYDDIVLVGHSLAGCTMPGAIRLLGERVRHAVFVACTVPEDGTSSLDTLDPEFKARIADGGSVLTPEIARAVFGNDLDDEQFAWMTARMVPEAPALPSEPVDLAPLREGSFARTWIRPTRDAIVSPDKQLRFARNVGDCPVVDLDAGHMCMISKPAELASLLAEIG
jgi:pimeloyl-ACP methyl ester carboxylesterase